MVIDFKTILDPFKITTIIGQIDKTYSEILVADQLQLIEAGFEGDMTIGLDLFKEPTFPDGDFWKGTFGCTDSEVMPNNFMMGLKLLRKAFDAGMVSVYDSEKYAKVGKDIFNVNLQYSPTYHFVSPKNFKVRICLDWGYDALASIIGAEAITGAVPVYSDLDFYEFISENKPEGTILGNNGKVEIIDTVQSLVEWPNVSNIDELFAMAKQIMPKYIDNSVNNSKGKNYKGIGLMTVELVTVYALDTVVFMGLPISTGTIFLYKVCKKLLGAK